jgi:uncharacterized SAM-binding protein YcdF (DUF218 family)
MTQYLIVFADISLYLLILLGFGLYLRWKRYKHTGKYWSVLIVVFLICSTSYVPKKLIHSIEKSYAPLEIKDLDSNTLYYVYVLGAGAGYNEQLPASMNLSHATSRRLMEGIRLYRACNNAILVTSAGLARGNRTQASITRDAAIELGMEGAQIEMLETATNTIEEAQSFKARYGAEVNLILVTSALHMPRAIEIFNDNGLDPLPAPCDFIYKNEGHTYNGFTFPSFGSLSLMNNYQITALKSLYYRLKK